MKRRFLTGALVLIATCAVAAETGVFIDDASNIREGPGTTFKVLAQSKKGVTFEVLERQEKWLKVRTTAKKEGWTNLINVKLDPAVLPAPVDLSVGQDAVVSAPSGTNVRDKASVKGAKVGSLKTGERLKILEKSAGTETIENLTARWYRIEAGKVQGWAFGGFLAPEAGSGGTGPEAVVTAAGPAGAPAGGGSGSASGPTAQVVPVSAGASGDAGGSGAASLPRVPVAVMKGPRIILTPEELAMPWEERRAQGKIATYGGIKVMGGLLPNQGQLGALEIYHDGAFPAAAGKEGEATVYKTDGNLQVFYRAEEDLAGVRFQANIVDWYQRP